VQCEQEAPKFEKAEVGGDDQRAAPEFGCVLEMLEAVDLGDDPRRLFRRPRADVEIIGEGAAELSVDLSGGAWAEGRIEQLEIALDNGDAARMGESVKVSRESGEKPQQPQRENPGEGGAEIKQRGAV
jgi:hypothetical protein